MSKIYKEWLKISQDSSKFNYDIGYYIKFILLWVSYNSYYNTLYVSSGMKDYEKAVKMSIKTFNKISDKDIKENADILKFYEFINNKEYEKGAIYNLKKSQRVEAKEPSIINFMELIYAIRCNLFHGGKEINSETNKKIVELAYDSFLSIYKKII